MTIPTIAIYSVTGLLPVHFIQEWIPSAQIAIDRDFAPWWSGAILRYAAPGTVIEPDEWQLVFLDHTDQAGALGLHDLTDSGLPLMKIFFADVIANKTNWCVTATHEIYEAIVDPYMNRTVEFDGYEYALECADAPEDDNFAVRVAGHMASNAVTPAWFDPNGAAPFTIYPCDEITAPFMLASGGYIGRRKLPDGQWEQRFADGLVTPRMIKGPASRTMRRFQNG